MATVVPPISLQTVGSLTTGASSNVSLRTVCGYTNLNKQARFGPGFTAPYYNYDPTTYGPVNFPNAVLNNRAVWGNAGAKLTQNCNLKSFDHYTTNSRVTGTASTFYNTTWSSTSVTNTSLIGGSSQVACSVTVPSSGGIIAQSELTTLGDLKSGLGSYRLALAMVFTGNIPGTYSYTTVFRPFAPTSLNNTSGTVYIGGSSSNVVVPTEARIVGGTSVSLVSCNGVAFMPVLISGTYNGQSHTSLNSSSWYTVPAVLSVNFTFLSLDGDGLVGLDYTHP